MSTAAVSTADDGYAAKYAPRTVRSVSHAIELVRILAGSAEARTLSDLSRRVSLSKPSVYGLLNSLVSEGLVRRDECGHYRVGWGALELAAQVEEPRALEAGARSVLSDLAGATRGAALLSVANRKHVLYVGREQQDWSFDTVATIGHRSPWHATASGKVLLAHQSSKVLSHVLAEPLTRSTSSTLTEPGALRRELARVKSHGFATCWGEHEPLLSSLAVPVFDRRGTMRAALAVAVPTEFLRKVPATRVVNRLRSASRTIREALN
ncbi:IclR family transcriptional regulator [Allosalinactinospora lopnorensis]|uniref:IclR family transcriptional regulator n=1 Tax=Allosalinactinospora lopnorensis TaxID=1352348 RepID=UPI000623D581|nr:IclR family transcriptional regulator [Allosalinactinospora lopnorensis]